jgi:hypothetical protein
MTDMSEYLIYTSSMAGMRGDKHQEIYRFPNGYGASVLDADEVYVIKFDGPGPYDWDRAPDKETGIATQHGILRFNSDEKIVELLEKIKEVKA